MIFSLFLLDKVHGGRVILLGTAFCALVYFALSLIPHGGRTGRGLLTTALSLLCCEAVCTLFWYLIYFPDGSYYNYGIGGVYGMLLYPFILLVAGCVAGAVNTLRKEEH